MHEIVALKSYRDQLRATLAGIDAEIAAKNTRLAAHDAESPRRARNRSMVGREMNLLERLKGF